MKKTILSIGLLAAAFLFSSEYTFAQSKKKTKDKILANKVYTVDIAETTGKKIGKKSTDEISFKSEKLNSKFMTSENHFPATTYTVTVDSTANPPEITFTSEETNADGETLKWEGTITGNEIQATAVISKKGKTKKEYDITGTMKEKPGAKK